MKPYFFLDKNNQQQGPVQPERFAENGVTPQTLVWTEGMANWAPAETILELRPYLQTPEAAVCPPPPPRQPQPQRATLHSQTYQQPRPDNHLVWAILATVCCCLPFGIVAIVKSMQVNDFYNSGKYDQALIAAEEAKNWCLVSLVLGIISCCVGSAINFFN
ncbi:MAG: CD225/dispanin family protein [Alloprevotella sp.]